MTRRALGAMGLAVAMGAAARPAVSPAAPLKPPVLKPGDLAGIVAPSTQVTDPDKLQLAERTVEYFGLRPKWGAHVRSHRAQDIATIDERADDLHAMFRDPAVKAVFCIRGGYGSAQILKALDYDLIARNPKVFIGYSDITALHLAIHQRTGLVTFHGPILLSEFTSYTLDVFKRALFSAAPLGSLTNPRDTNPLRPSHRLRSIHGGRVEGRLIGGNLSLISSLMGTPFEIDTRDRLFFTEDVGEEPYRIDRMLTQLRLAEKLTQARGVLFGECSDCGPRDFKPSFSWNLTLGEVLDESLKDLNKPVLYGLTIGHTDDQLTLPLGITATLDADAGTLVINEAATA